MTVFILALGVVTLVMVQMTGAILYVTSSLPPQPLLKVLARYLKHGEEEEPVELFPPIETTTRLLKIRRRTIYLIAVVLFSGAAAGTVCGFLQPGALQYVIPGCLVAALNLLIFLSALSVWIRQCRAMRDSDWMEQE